MTKKDKKAIKEAPKPIRNEPVSKPIARDSFFKRHLYCIIIFSFSFLLFANSIPNDYNLDDELVTNHHRLTSKGISAIPEIFASPYYNDGHYAYEYRPVVLSTFAIENSLFGDDPHVSHFINVLLYSLSCVLLFNTLRKLLPAVHPLFHLAVTLLFVAHPAHTEVVCNIKCRDEILALLFSLGALSVAVNFAREKKWWLLTLVVVLYGLALLSKLTIISFAIIIPLSLILFTEASLVAIILLSTLLMLVSLPLINLTTFIQKMMLGIGLLLSVIGAYIFIKPSTLFAFVKRNTPDDLPDSVDQDALFKPGTGFAPLLKGIKPAREIFSFDAAFLPIIFSASAFAGIFLHIGALMLIGGAGLFIFLLIDNARFAWWAAILFYLVSIAALIQFPLDVTIYTDLVAIALAYQIFFGRRDLFIPSLVLFLVFMGVCIFLHHYKDAIGPIDYINTLYFLLFFLCLRWKYTWPVSALIFIGAVHSPINYIFFIKYSDKPSPIFTINTIYYGGALLVMMTTLMFLKRSLMRPLALLSSACSLVIIVYFLFNSYDIQANYHSPNGLAVQNFSVMTTPNGPEKFIKSIDPTLVPGKINRPLRYLEQPVNVNDPISLRLGTSAEILFEYLHKTILPYPLSYYYGYRFIEPVTISSPIAIAGLILYILLTLLAIWLLKKEKIPGYALMFYLISIVVFSNFLQPVPGLLADRFMLVPSIGWCLLFVWLLLKVLKTDPANLSLPSLPSKAKYAFTALLVLYTGITFARNFQWKDDVTLFSHDINYVDNSSQAHDLLATHLMQSSFAKNKKDAAGIEKLREEAAVHYQKALDIYPDYLNAAYDLGRTYALLGAQLVQENRPDEANQYFKQAEVAFLSSMRIDSTYLPAEYQLATVFDQEGRYDEAIKLYRKQIAHEPANLEPYLYLSYVYFKEKNYQASISVNKEALEKIPNAYDPTVNTAKSYSVLNETDSAYVWMEKAFAINPKDMDLVKQLYAVSKEKGYAEKADFYGNILGVNKKGN